MSAMQRAPRGSVVTEVSQVEDATEYQRLYRQRRPKIHARQRAKTNARYAAALKVAKRHPDEFDRAIRREERARGLR